MSAPKKKAVEQEVDVIEVTQERIDVCVLGTTPLICNRMSEKAKHELLMPRGRKNAAERATTLKHNPMEEFRSSPYRLSDAHAPTLIAILAASFKKAMETAALDLPGTKKAQIARLVRVEGLYAGVYGVPQLLMSVVRSADMNRTPDVRSRAIIPQWAARLNVSVTRPLMRAQAAVRLLAAAGVSCGVGDWRLEKGSGDFGLFKLVEPDDADFQAVIANGGRTAQAEALQSPQCYDDETAELLSWFDEELSRRQIKGVA